MLASSINEVVDLFDRRFDGSIVPDKNGIVITGFAIHIHCVSVEHNVGDSFNVMINQESSDVEFDEEVRNEFEFTRLGN